MPRLNIPNEVLLPEVDKLLSEGMSVTLRVKGNSMLPFIVGERDSVVLIKANDLQIGDIVLARLGNGHYVMHRIIAMSHDIITIMGDGNLQGTEQCNRSAISGKVIKIERNGKFVNADDKGELLKVWLWRKLKPVRRYLLAIYRRM